MKLMPQIIPIKDLKNTGVISQKCRQSKEPIYITKNGYGDMVIMSMQAYEEKLYMLDLYAKLDAASKQIVEGKVIDADESLSRIREELNV
jgi:PHD/YefM family antitoxin component YafN of YafNO toxin-antitoxin module